MCMISYIFIENVIVKENKINYNKYKYKCKFQKYI